ncbi:Hsp20/alpha crystallin family protein [Paraburkholderia phenoliruptrix]|uniref:Hsp20/alpha crystallin family protein n=1 Tax=Paraburkholderia phenoliruptrix TaxID=252970 RepID=UPI001C6E437C|nr:Hsp20/alpha crystallin family protein [Paraburkholderia phenoliruptrix]MBW9107033.1 Hsp20/alpha crystallin family protein [Paraburkholderia phenoliruptrix]MBW9132134.1 Hsp20/alpha crystallin family protein [Paraburkholderia ginsengiterrae]
MSNMTRFDPFALEPMSELFQGLFRPMRGAGGEPLADIKLDVTESDTAYSVKAELPGVEKKDIDVKIDGNLVSISAKVERNQEMKDGERVIRRERYAGAVSRAFSLANEVDESSAAAEYKDGVLSLTLPKKASSERKRLQIN